MLDLAAGRIDGYISDIPALQYYVKDKPTYAVVERIPTGEQYSIMFAKAAPLGDKVDAVIADLKKEGFIAGLHEKWFGAKAEADDLDRQGDGAAETLIVKRAAGRRPPSPEPRACPFSTRS